MNLDEKIYKKLLDVPKGQITTYGELAKAVGLKNGQRVVGRVMNKNPYPVIIPCHRVVMSTGKIGGYAFGQDIKVKMLRFDSSALSKALLYSTSSTPLIF